jgi:Dullard-like phosphatase family protein
MLWLQKPLHLKQNVFRLKFSVPDRKYTILSNATSHTELFLAQDNLKSLSRNSSEHLLVNEEGLINEMDIRNTYKENSEPTCACFRMYVSCKIPYCFLRVHDAEPHKSYSTAVTPHKNYLFSIFSYTTPRRSKKSRRCSHIGLSSLSIEDNIHNTYFFSPTHNIPTHMSTSRTLLRSLQTLANPASQARLVAAARGGSITRQHQVHQVLRSQSTWVTPNKRGRRYSDGSSRRPIVNGKSVAFHIKDLETQHNSNSFASTTTLQPQNEQPLSLSRSIKKQPIREYDSDLVVVLDMDECIIHSQFLDGPGAKYAHQVRRTGTEEALAGESSSQVVDTFHISLPDGEMVRVHERPGLHQFLKQVSSKYETHIFTAAMEVYAKPLLDVLDPHGTIFTHCWYRESCRLDSTVGAYVKNLGAVGWAGDRLKRTVLVDNNPLSFLANPSNGILVSSFYNDPQDTTLPAVMDLLDELNEQPDVRPILESRFGLKQALDEIQSGRPTNSRHSQLDVQVQQQQQAVAVASS